MITVFLVPIFDVLQYKGSALQLKLLNVFAACNALTFTNGIKYIIQ